MDEVGSDTSGTDRFIWIGYSTLEKLHSLGADLLDPLPGDSQPRSKDVGPFEIVECDDREVLWYPNSPRPRGAHHSDCRRAIAGDEGGGRVGQRQQPIEDGDKA